MNKLIPRLTVSNLNHSLQFYTKAIGFSLIEQTSERQATIRLEDSYLNLHQTDMNWGTAKLSYPYGVGINFQFWVSSLDNIYSGLKDNNYPLYDEYFSDAYSQTPTLSNDQQIVVLDPDGYLLTFLLKK